MYLRAGDLSMVYENGFLRYIKLGDYEVLRMIYFALRDHNWDTMPGQIVDEELDIQERSFSISYTWKSTSADFPFFWNVDIKGTSDEQVVFSIEGEATADVRKNRTGFCILHSVPENMGNACQITAPDGKVVSGQFPRYISPHQPFQDIQKMEWPLDPFGDAILSFSGDVFEMEDQRNWTDDSYKTYCTPLEKPFPVLLKKGEQVSQRVDLVVHKKQEISEVRSGACILALGKVLTKKPALGIAAAPLSEPLHPNYAEKISQLNFDVYQIEVDFSNPFWRENLKTRLIECQLLNLELRVVLFFTENYLEETQVFLKEVKSDVGVHLNDVLVLSKHHKSTPAKMIDEVVPMLREALGSTAIGAGTNAYFTELNRDRIQDESLDFVSYSVNPQVHAFDDSSLVECSIAQAYTVESARQYFPQKGVHVAPITLRPRFNPNATSEDTPLEEGALPDTVDSRQWSLFGAGWTLSSILSLAKSGADRAVYFQTVGLNGIFLGPDAQLAEAHDLRVPKVYPVYHVLDVILSHKDADWIPIQSSDPLSVCGLAIKVENGFKLLIANLKDQELHAEVAFPVVKYRMVFLDNELQERTDSVRFFEEEISKLPLSSASELKVTLPSNAIAYAEII